MKTPREKFIERIKPTLVVVPKKKPTLQVTPRKAFKPTTGKYI